MYTPERYGTIKSNAIDNVAEVRSRLGVAIRRIARSPFRIELFGLYQRSWGEVE